MTEQEAIEKLKECQKSGDPERAHGESDKVLCNLLISLGYSDVVSEWAKVPKWYS